MGYYGLGKDIPISAVLEFVYLCSYPCLYLPTGSKIIAPIYSARLANSTALIFPLVIDIFPMLNSYNEYCMRMFLDAVHHPIVADPESAQRPSISNRVYYKSLLNSVLDKLSSALGKSWNIPLDHHI